VQLCLPQCLCFRFRRNGSTEALGDLAGNTLRQDAKVNSRAVRFPAKRGG